MPKQPPLCRDCELGTRHWPHEPHLSPRVTESPEVLVTITHNVTEVPANNVTPCEPLILRSKGKRGRPRRYGTNAQRQAAYRGRKA